MAVRTAYEHIQCAEIVKALPEDCAKFAQTINPAQARELGKAPESERVKIIKVVVSRGDVTAKTIRAVILATTAKAKPEAVAPTPDVATEVVADAPRIIWNKAGTWENDVAQRELLLTIGDLQASRHLEKLKLEDLWRFQDACESIAALAEDLSGVANKLESKFTNRTEAK